MDYNRALIKFADAIYAEVRDSSLEFYNDGMYMGTTEKGFEEFWVNEAADLVEQFLAEFVVDELRETIAERMSKLIKRDLKWADENKRAKEWLTNK